MFSASQFGAVGRVMLLALTLAVISRPLAAQIFDGSIQLTQQVQVDTFHYAEVTGSLTIRSGNAGDEQPITNLDSLSRLVSVGWDLTIQDNPLLTSISGLSGLSHISDRLTLSHNPSLRSLDGLETLGYLEGLDIIGNDSLLSIGGLSGIHGIGAQGLVLIDNPLLADLSGLANLETIGGHVVLQELPSLTGLLGLSALKSVAGNLNLIGLGRTSSLSGLENLVSIGRLWILGNDSLRSLTGLNGLAAIAGELAIYHNPVLESLEGLDNLSSLGSLYLGFGNDALHRASGLVSLDSVWGSVDLDGTSLTTLADFDKLVFIGGGLQISNSLSLTDIDGFSNIRSLGDRSEVFGTYQYLYVAHNSELAALTGLSNLEKVTGYVTIFQNPALEDLSELTSLKEVEADLVVWSNPNLTSLHGLENVTSVGALRIDANERLRDLSGLSNLSHVLTGVQVFYNDSLSSLSGLDALRTMQGLHIQGNGLLANVDGLINLDSLGYLQVRNNPKLENLDGLRGVVDIRAEIAITENPMLSNCSCGLGTLLGSTSPDFVTISNNAEGCNNAEEVLAGEACSPPIRTSIDTDDTAPAEFALSQNYPNPFNPTTTIQYDLTYPTEVRLDVFDPVGRKVALLINEKQTAGRHEVVWNASSLPSGVYFYRLQAGDFSASGSASLSK